MIEYLLCPNDQSTHYTSLSKIMPLSFLILFRPGFSGQWSRQVLGLAHLCWVFEVPTWAGPWGPIWSLFSLLIYRCSGNWSAVSFWWCKDLSIIYISKYFSLFMDQNHIAIKKLLCLCKCVFISGRVRMPLKVPTIILRTTASKTCSGFH